jgi:tetratricopeptide (TPR) repeat protein
MILFGRLNAHSESANVLIEQLNTALRDGYVEAAETQLDSISDKDISEAQQLAFQARIELLKERYKPARKLIEKALDRAPEDAEIQFRAGQIYGEVAKNSGFLSALKYAKRSQKYFRKAVELDSENVRNHRALIFYLIQAPGVAGGDQEEALALARELKPLSALDSFLMELEVYYATGDLEKQSEIIDQAVMDLPEEPEVYVRRGYIREVNGESELAIEDMEHAIRLSGSDDRDVYLNAVYQSCRISNQIGMNSVAIQERLRTLLEALKAPRFSGLKEAVERELDKIAVSNL